MAPYEEENHKAENHEFKSDAIYFAKKVLWGLEKDDSTIGTIHRDAKRLSVLIDAEVIFRNIRRANAEAIIIQYDSEAEFDNDLIKKPKKNVYHAHLLSYKKPYGIIHIVKNRYGREYDVDVSDEVYRSIENETKKQFKEQFKEERDSND